MHRITLTSGPLRAVATPDGGGLLELSIEQNGCHHHILRPASAAPATPLDRAMIVMAPWCNRIGGGGVRVGDRFYPIAPNVDGFPMPLHGTAFQNLWTVADQRDTHLEMMLDAPATDNFSYQARISYTLSPTDLTVRLTVINTGRDPMPFGIGLHPWFATDDRTSLQFHATKQVMTDDSGLPTQIGNLVDDFGIPRELPDGRIDHSFLGWGGCAKLRNADSVVTMRSTAPILHVFSPSPSAEFCCLEPQTTFPNSANFEPNGTSLLANNAEASLAMTISRIQTSG